MTSISDYGGAPRELGLRACAAGSISGGGELRGRQGIGLRRGLHLLRWRAAGAAQRPPSPPYPEPPLQPLKTTAALAALKNTYLQLLQRAA
jgi:hypothetical protein